MGRGGGLKWELNKKLVCQLAQEEWHDKEASSTEISSESFFCLVFPFPSFRFIVCHLTLCKRDCCLTFRSVSSDKKGPNMFYIWLKSSLRLLCVNTTNDNYHDDTFPHLSSSVVRISTQNTTAHTNFVAIPCWAFTDNINGWIALSEIYPPKALREPCETF